MEQFTQWTVGGVGATIALVFSNLSTVSPVVTPVALRWSLILLAISLLAGVISKNIGMAVTNGLATIMKMESLLQSEQGHRLMSMMTIPLSRLPAEIAEGFCWPLSALMRRSASRGATDPLFADKRLLKMWCVQLLFNLIHALAAIAAVLTLALSIR
jgi:hypothetical protein